jgi:PAS domain S-box-containing protein
MSETGQALEVLVLEDSPLDAELIEEHLQRANIRPNIHRVTTREAFEGALGRLPFDLILADYNLPSFDGLSALKIAAHQTPHTPFILVSGTLTEDAAIEAMRNGASDFVVKQRLTRLPDAVKRALNEAEDRKARQIAETELEKTNQSLSATVEKLQWREEQLRLATEMAGIGFWDVDVVNGTLMWDENCRAMFGITTAEDVSMADFNAGLHPDDFLATTSAFAAAIDPDRRTPYYVEYRTVGREDGVIRWVAAKGRGIFDESGRCLRATGTTLDITALKRVALRRSLLSGVSEILANADDLGTISYEVGKLLGEAFGACRVGYGTIDGDDTVTVVRNWTAPGVENVNGRFDLRRYGTFVDDLQAGRTVTIPDVKADERTRGHGPAFIEMHIGSLLNIPIVEGGRTVAMLFVNHAETWDWAPDDISLIGDAAQRVRTAIERKRAEAALLELASSLEDQVNSRTDALAHANEALRQAQKMEAVGQLTGGIAHDFNNMLAVTTGSLELLRRRVGETDAKMLRYVDSALEGCRRAANLTTRLLAFSRQSALNPRTLDVNQLISDMADLVQHSIGADIILDISLASEVWPILVDPNQLENVLLNLAVNARDAMMGGGQLSLETLSVDLEASDTRPRGMPIGQYVRIRVKDTGEGMAPDVLQKAFDPFFTTKGVGKGTGLGLSQVYGFVAQSGGYIDMQSEVGVGTTVDIFLPKTEVSIGSSAIGTPDDLAVGKPGEVILVVDDEPGVRQFTCEALLELGYTVVEAANAHHALDLLAERDDITLLFSDIVMPEMNGFELVEKSLVIRPNLKVLHASGYTHDSIVKGRRLDGETNLISKPFSVDDLARRVREVLG